MSVTERPDADPGANGSTVLDSVRRLERELEDRRGVEEVAGARRAAARAEAGRIVREARSEAEREAAEHRRLALDRADEEAERLLREARAEVGALRALAARDLAAATQDVLDVIFPGRGG